MDDDADRWKRIAALLDKVLDSREAKERAGKAKLARLLARQDRSTASGNVVTSSRRPRRGRDTH